MTITGTRSVAEQTERQLPALFDDYLRPFVDANTFYLGGAVGIDTIALDWLAEHTQVALSVVVPCTVDDQPTIAVRAVRRWQRSGRIANLVELHADKLGSRAYHARNRWMVDRSDLVIGFPHGTDPTAGTWHTLNYAAELGKPRLVVPI